MYHNPDPDLPTRFTRRFDRATGRYSSRVYHLETRRPPATAPRAWPAAVELAEWPHPTDAEYLALFHRIGDPWLWYGRLTLPSRDRQALFRHPAYEFRRVMRGERAIGLLELDRRDRQRVEIAYLGLVPGATGQGLGRPLLDAALVLAWRGSPERVTLHTCTEDHPNALAAYRAAGFEVIAVEEEWVDDPRLTGLLPESAGPHVPLAR